ncbi:MULTISPECIES: nitroreductase/quinone reductase family protein [Streptomyces]|uniref:Nitroreductase/quinone reductase family protein n=2 Tax=Streptomyces TaxID=1883 RepID=A0A9X2LT78_STRMQ|nr:MULTISPECIES: nitroreductase/quinone reductase family protein [Streptomyces]AQA11473.1 hypothetical protein BV401_14250 [Streptomyces autolyticus]ATL82393.1 hypothetical protein SMALA_2159 [Streptomyces malaysiensis]MCD9592978.1 nitroreductase/quinone reductase family protein [Streptomyces sp. 8ZJF_21]MCQ8829147.1 nitroreductase/quinone reductase family protein [Streptomyces samsunensis]UHH17349.1 nitroreductase/quinone reductase family protein [Streptomyces sp. HNM0561]
MRYKGPLPKRFTDRFNAWMVGLRSSPRWGRRVSGRLTVVTYTGRRSGRTFSTPVAYRRAADAVTITVAMPERKLWWRNFTGEGGPISLDLDGSDRTGHAVARVDEKGRVTITVRLDQPPAPNSP